MADFREIPLNDVMISILKKCGPALTGAVRWKFGCTPAIHGVDVDSAPSPTQPTGGPQKRYSKLLSNGMTVSVWKDDLTTHKVDVVVNAANKRLEHGGGLARALCDAGGPDIQRESKSLIKTNGKLSTGEAVVTKAGKLPCKMVIHAVGPELPFKPTSNAIQQATPLLKKAVESILAVVEKEGPVQSVAIPALSSGLFNFPLDLCADTIVTTLKNYSDHRYRTKPLDIRLVNHDEKSVAEMESACTRILGSTVSFSQPVQSHGNTTWYNQTGQSHGNSASYSQSVQSHGNPPSYSQTVQSHGNSHTNKSTSSRFQICNVNLTLKMGNIEQEKADVIVNSTAPGMKLSEGVISGAISQKAGVGMQRERDQMAYGATGDVLETNGYKLDCRKVYHVICAGRFDPSAPQILHRVITKCLEKAAGGSYRSISFPAIGTGNLGFLKREVADIMTMAVFEFATNFQVKMDINFVIYHADSDTLEAFKEKLGTLQSTAGSHHSSTSGIVQTDNPHKSTADNPRISLSNAPAERIAEAELWIYGVFCPVRVSDVTIQNNFIQHFGQLQHEELQSLQTKWSVSIRETLLDGRASVLITGDRRGVVAARLEVEAMCCKVQEEFAKEEESDLAVMTNSKVSHQRKSIEPDQEMRRSFAGFRIVNAEKLENPSLKQAFELKKKQLSAKPNPQLMYQRVPGQFCDMVGRVGFQREYSPPAEQRYGAGIYFSSSVTEAERLWKNLPEEHYLYFVGAQVLTGRSTQGSPDLIVPPAIGSDPLHLYDSVRGVDTHAIFNGHQALPEYLFTCKKTGPATYP